VKLLRCVCAVVSAVTLFLAGCGVGQPRTAVVRGKVTYQGKPVPGGTILFTPTSGPPATGGIQPDGSYTLTTFRKGDGAVPGSHKVVIVAVDDTSNILPEARNPLPPPIIPAKYSSAATSDLKAEVQDKENTIDFNLEADKKKK